MSQSNDTQTSGSITYRANGEAQSFEGREAVEVFRLATLMSALRFEIKCPGMRVSRHVNALKIAKQTTGLRTNNRQTHLDRLTVMLAEQKQKVAHVTAEQSAAAEQVRSTPPSPAPVPPKPLSRKLVIRVHPSCFTVRVFWLSGSGWEPINGNDGVVYHRFPVHLCERLNSTGLTWALEVYGA